MHLLLFRGDDVLGEQTSIYEIFGMKGQVFSQLAYTIPQNEQSSAEDNLFPRTICFFEHHLEPLEKVLKNNDHGFF